MPSHSAIFPFPAVFYGNVVEKTTSEFVVNYGNQQLTLANSIQLTMLDIDLLINNTSELLSRVAS